MTPTPSSHPLITVMAPAQEVAIVWEGTAYTLTALNVDDDGALRFMCAAYHKPDSDERAWLGVERHGAGLRASILHYGSSEADAPIVDLDLIAVLDTAAEALRAARATCSDDDNAILAQALGAIALAKAKASPPAPKRAHGFERDAHNTKILKLTPGAARSVRGAAIDITPAPTPKEPQMKLTNAPVSLGDLTVTNVWKVERDPVSRRPKMFVSFSLKLTARLDMSDQVMQLVPGLADAMENMLNEATSDDSEGRLELTLKRSFPSLIWTFGSEHGSDDVKVELRGAIKGAPKVTIGATCKIALQLTADCEASAFAEVFALLLVDGLTVTTSSLQQDLPLGDAPRAAEPQGARRAPAGALLLDNTSPVRLLGDAS